MCYESDETNWCSVSENRATDTYVREHVARPRWILTGRDKHSTLISRSSNAYMSCIMNLSMQDLDFAYSYPGLCDNNPVVLFVNKSCLNFPKLPVPHNISQRNELNSWEEWSVTKDRTFWLEIFLLNGRISRAPSPRCWIFCPHRFSVTKLRSQGYLTVKYRNFFLEKVDRKLSKRNFVTLVSKWGD